MPRARKPGLEDLPSTGYGDKAALMAQAQDTPFISPDEVPNLSAPSARPGEPLTTGLPIGDGAGPEVLSPMGSSPERQVLQAMLLRTPSNDIMRLLDLMDEMGR